MPEKTEKGQQNTEKFSVKIENRWKLLLKALFHRNFFLGPWLKSWKIKKTEKI